MVNDLHSCFRKAHRESAFRTQLIIERNGLINERNGHIVERNGLINENNRLNIEINKTVADKKNMQIKINIIQVLYCYYYLNVKSQGQKLG